MLEKRCLFLSVFSDCFSALEYVVSDERNKNGKTVYSSGPAG